MSPKPDLSGFRTKAPEQEEPKEGGEGETQSSQVPPPPPPSVPKIRPTPGTTPPRSTDDQPTDVSAGSTGSTSERRKPRRQRKEQGSQRLLVNVPLKVAHAAKEAADQENIYLSHFVLRAFRDQRVALRKELGQSKKPGGEDPFEPPAATRRKNVEDATQFVFTVPRKAAEAIDELAEYCGLNRSELVTVTLERQLKTSAST